MSSFNGTVALVTGSTRGIGRGIATAFGREGANVVVNGRNADEGQETVQQVHDAGGEAIFVRADVRNESEVNALIDETLSEYGQLDYAINNAGAETTHPFVNMGTDDYNVNVDTNLEGTFLCMKHELRHMANVGAGAIVNTAAAVGQVPVPQHTLYCASKAGVIMLTKTAALEVADEGVRVNAVTPATIEGEMLRKYMEAENLTDDQVISGMPIGRIGQPEDVANAVLFLCSNQASYITETSLTVDGGFSLKGV